MSDDYDPKEAARRDLATARESGLWDAAVEATAKELGDEGKKTVLSFDDGDWAVQHFFGGMRFRNFLRRSGFHEEDFGIENLDNVYVEILKEAATREEG